MPAKVLACAETRSAGVGSAVARVNEWRSLSAGPREQFIIPALPSHRPPERGPRQPEVCHPDVHLARLQLQRRRLLAQPLVALGNLVLLGLVVPLQLLHSVIAALARRLLRRLQL